ncbi:MAG: hypothetical protein HKO85_03125 [Xanthomonadales bacterium]|nr:hypothetical protein [Gammaproteobacteria bacterium]MBT8051198.1 hypothetical protein [Gammaproteobacteria bacterium]MBT8056363.1 hypothetical protein [Gammaproteobacteria bacterium]NNJ78608.1 hypothetical protein [Xanthomonadales bacterium]NNL04254.1 hypothetical protein [Xanthomonadales bacterium]
MADTKHMACAQTDIANAPGQLNESLLWSEIEFWQEMIETRCDDLPGPTVERMQFALALAKRRLAEIRDPARHDQPDGVVTNPQTRSAQP